MSTKDTPQTLYFIITPKTQENVYKTFYHGYVMHNTTLIKYHTKKWEANMKTCKTSIILSISTNPIQQTQQNKPNPYLSITFFKSQQQLKNQEIKGYKHEILWEK